MNYRIQVNLHVKPTDAPLCKYSQTKKNKFKVPYQYIKLAYISKVIYI